MESLNITSPFESGLGTEQPGQQGVPNLLSDQISSPSLMLSVANPESLLEIAAANTVGLTPNPSIRAPSAQQLPATGTDSLLGNSGIVNALAANVTSNNGETSSSQKGAIALATGHYLIDGLGGDAGFGENYLERNDDGSTDFIDITAVFPSGLNFFGKIYQGFYINNNGNITFNEPSSTFIPFALTDNTQNPIIAPFFTDIDTRAGSLTPSPGGNSKGTNLVYWDLAPENKVITITWDDVGKFSWGTTPNAFQLRLIGLEKGDWAIEYRYETIQWHRGDARAGWNAGNNNNFFELPQSGTEAMLELETASNINDPGRFLFTIRNGIPNRVPSDIILSATSINENSAAGTIIGNLSTLDPDLNDTHTYTLINDGQGNFALNNNQLIVSAKANLDYEKQTSYTIEVRSQDQGLLYTTKTFTININNILEPDVKLTTATSPVSINLGESALVNWTVSNIGDTAMSVNWEDGVYLSVDTTWDENDRLLTQKKSSLALLGTEKNYTLNQDIIITHTETGNYYLLFVSDKNKTLTETNENNNILVKEIQLTAPDLTLSALNIPSQVIFQPRQKLNLSYKITNSGTSTATGWFDRIYLFLDGTLNNSILLDTISHTSPLLASQETTVSKEITLPEIAEGNYKILIVTDADQTLIESPSGESNNTLLSNTIQIAYPDLIATITSLPTTATSNSTIPLTWTTSNRGKAPTLDGWRERIYLSLDNQYDASDLLLKEFNSTKILAANSDQENSINLTLPRELNGDYYILLKSDVDNSINEGIGEQDNLIASPIKINLAPYADLEVSQITAPTLTVADRATLNISWTVTNKGTGIGLEPSWVDKVILSTDEILGNSDDKVIKQYTYSDGLQVGSSYTRNESILLPPAFTGRYHLFVQTDAQNAVFENGLKSNNTLIASNIVDITPRPYADLTVSSVTTQNNGSSGQPLTVSWTVTNSGIGITNTNTLTDEIFLSNDPTGQNLIKSLLSFERVGALAVGNNYTKSENIILPHGISGTYYLVVKTAGPDEFIYINNNSSISNPINVALTPSPDLQVTSITAPSQIQAGQKIDVTWTVTNTGVGVATGEWIDAIFLTQVGQPDANPIPLATFSYNSPLQAGKFYQRLEQITLPSTLNGSYQILVKTNNSNSLYEGGATANNSTLDDSTITISQPPRPDLQVSSITAPATVNAGGTLDLSFTVINQGTAATTSKWFDKIYLSTDLKIDSGDLLLGNLINQSALNPGESYQGSLTSAIIPKRFRGQVFLIVAADADSTINEFPNEDNNTSSIALNVIGLEPSDLVTSNVVAPQEAFEGSTIKIRYKVTNRGLGETDRDSWTDTIWLTKDRNRPSATNYKEEPEDILLKTITHQGSLAKNADYEKDISITLPEKISGEWYITAWSDAYDVVLENTLDININPDDPNEIDNNNYKARPIAILLTPPSDLVVTNITSTGQAQGGNPFSVTWTVKNQGNSATNNETWIDSIYLSDKPTLNATGANIWHLGDVKQTRNLQAGHSYTDTLDVILSPAVKGQYIIVKTNADSSTNIWEGPYNNNNELSHNTNVTNTPADLTIKSIIAPKNNFSGEPITLKWTVENKGGEIWSGTKYWSDEVWISPDPTFIEERATKLGSFLYTLSQPLKTGESSTQEKTVTLPKGIDGNYYIYLNPNAQGIIPQSGDNTESRKQFTSRVFEDPSNNLSSQQIQVTYREPNLQVSDLIVPTTAPYSGDTIAVSWTVTNRGTRATRENYWVDRVYLSRDPSLDWNDQYLGSFERTNQLGIGQSYQGSANITLPEGIEENFYLLVFSDANIIDANDSQVAYVAPINAKIYFERNYPFNSSRVPEFKDEGNNIKSISLPIKGRPFPDLQVGSIIIPERATIGQTFDLTYTVTNRGTGSTPISQSHWQDLIYLSRDEYLDVNSDYYLDFVPQNNKILNPLDSYTINKTLSIPTYLTGPFYVFVITDPAEFKAKGGKVFEGNGEGNNATASKQPLLLELPPPSDLVVNEITVPSTLTPGSSISIDWTVTNTGINAANGKWTDAVYLSTDSIWDIDDLLLGRVEYKEGTLAPNHSYKQTLETVGVPLKPGQYRLIVRPDIYNQIYEADGEANNYTTSASPLTITVDDLHLNTPITTSLKDKDWKLYQLQVQAGQTLKIEVDSQDNNSLNELFVRYGDVPTGTVYDAAYTGQLNADPSAIIPTTGAGTYYILVRHTLGGNSTPTTIKASVLPFSITDVVSDIGGDSRYVTTNIKGAQFKPGAIVKLIRPGIAEYTPVNYKVVDSTQITAIFDLRDANHGLYDVKVTNPDGSSAIVPYRYLVERTIEPDVTVGLGGPRIITPGGTGTYGLSVTSLTNIDTPYVHFQFGVPELGNNDFVYGLFNSTVTQAAGINKLPYLQLTSNLRGQPPNTPANLPWASLISNINTNGVNLAPGYVFDLPTTTTTGSTFNIQTYPGLTQLLALQPDAFKELLPDEHGSIAFKFNILASATALTRSEFITTQTAEALRLRTGILKDATTSIVLKNLAADKDTWTTAYLAALEEAGLLRDEDEAPPIRTNPLVTSLMSTLATGILLGANGEQILTDGNLISFFSKIRTWYGDNPNLIGSTELPSASNYNLGLSSPTHFETFNIYVPYGKARVDLPAGATVPPPNFNRFFTPDGTIGELGRLIGPVGVSQQGFIPTSQALPYTIQFENSPQTNRHVGEIRIVTQLDSDLDPRSFRLGDLQLGDISLHIPNDRTTFSGDFDFRQSKGFILRVNAGLDILSNTATWLLQAIDPKTGEVITDINKGLLAPNDSTGAGAGFVTYTVLPDSDVTTGTQITSSARILYNTSAPIDTSTLQNVIDSQAPTTTLTATPLVPGGSDYHLKWSATDDNNGSGVKHITVYVSDNGGNFTVWKRFSTETEGVFEGLAGHHYEFLAIATDNAGNTEKPSGITVPDDGYKVNLGTLPTVGQTTEPVIKPASPPTATISTNPLFIEATKAIPNAQTTTKPSEFGQILRPFTASAFVTGIPSSGANIGPMAIVTLEDGSVIASGGSNRGSLFHIPPTGATNGEKQLLSQLSTPIFDLALDENGSLWATTGGGALLRLNPTTGKIVSSYGDGLTQSLAINSTTGLIYVTSGRGIEVFDPIKETFTHLSDLRVGNLAFAPDGSLWAARWPDRGEIVRFDANGKPELMLKFDLPVDSLAFGKKGTALEGLLFVSSNSGELLMVDLATRQSIKVAQGGSRGDNIETTKDGRLLISQSNQIDVFSPLLSPRISFTNPVSNDLVALPKGVLTVTFDSDMYVGEGTEMFSVLNRSNFSLIDDANHSINPHSVRYDAATRTAFLSYNALNPDQYTLKVDNNLKSAAGVAMKDDYTVAFTAISDFSPFVDLQFTNTRSHRGNKTISFDVSLTNKTNYDLQLPLALLLQGLTSSTNNNDNSALLVDLSNTLPDGRLHPNQSITGYTLTVYNPSSLKLDFEPAIYTLRYNNIAPIITSTPNRKATVGQSWSYQLSATDPDGSVIGYLLYSAPEGMSINQQGLMTWTPTATTPIKTDVILQVYDSRGARTTQTFSIDVTGGNHQPVFNSLASEIKGKQGQKIELPINVTDTDGDVLQVWANNLPGGAIFDPITQVLTWTPTTAGTYKDVTFIVSDGIEQVQKATTFIIAPTNTAPTLLPPTPKSIQEGERIRFQLQANDPEGTQLTYSSNLLPPGSYLDPKTGVFEWTPSYFAAGVYNIPFTVSDGELTTTKTALITVNNVNAAPVFDKLDNWTIAEGQTLRFQAFAFDPDNPGFILPNRLSNGQLTPLEGSQPTVTYTVSNLPERATFDADTAIFSWKPSFTSAGTYNVTFSATDDGNGLTPITSSITVPITVSNVNRTPTIVEVSNQTVQRGQVLNLNIAATDLDGDSITLSATGLPGYDLPSWASFIDNGNGTGKLTLTPGIGDVGNSTITLKASDNQSEDDYSFIVSVVSSNEPPQIKFIGDKVAVVGTPLEFTVLADDFNQETLSFSSINLPPGATLTPTNIYGQALFNWTPTSSNLGNHSVTLKVSDSGTGNLSNILSTEQTFNLIVRNNNSAPILNPINNLTVAEGETLTFTPLGTDIDGDTLIYNATNLPSGAVLNPTTGTLTWKLDYFSAGIYNNIQLTVSDGNLSATRTFSINVNNTNRAPILTPITPQSGRENVEISFSLSAGDIDNDPIFYSSTSPLPTGASLDALTGKFSWKPNYSQAGNYVLNFTATDAKGATDTRSVIINIKNVNRNPVLTVSPQIVALGETLTYQIAATDADGDNLIYSAKYLPEGATLNSQTGTISFTPTPGQVGDYLIIYGVSDGLATTTQNALIRVETVPTLPTVTLDVTPGFPVIPGQKVIISAVADNFTDIKGLTLTVDGKALVLDSFNRASFTPSTSGRFNLVATATDAAGRVGQTSTVLKVRDVADSDAPIVAFAPGTGSSIISSITDIVGTVADTNLDKWVLSISDFGENDFRTLFEGQGTITGGMLTQLNPTQLANGFYHLRLSATDIKGRTADTQVALEVNSSHKNNYSNRVTDLSVSLAGTTLNLVRSYNSLFLDEEGSFGQGWQLANRDFDLSSNVTTGIESGTRLYLTLPTGERVGFTFAPIKQEITGVTYYTPAWVADTGVNWTIESEKVLLTKALSSFYDLYTGQPYQASAYKLTATDGTVYRMDARGRVTEQVTVNGTRLFFSDSGILSSSGEFVSFVQDDAGRLTRIAAPDGTTLVYDYNSSGQLMRVRNLSTGQRTNLGYSKDGLTLIAGEEGKVISYQTTPVVSSVTGDLGGAVKFISSNISENLTSGQTDYYNFNLRESELRSTATGRVLLGVEVQGVNGLPVLQKGTLVASKTTSNSTFGLFSLSDEGLNLLSVTGEGNYQLRLRVAGDVNADGEVNGVDSQLLNEAIKKGIYETKFDFNRDGLINGIDVQILGSNYGFSANKAPVVKSTNVLTHEDLSVSISLKGLATDAEGDEIFYRAVNPVNGTVILTSEGKTALFRPNKGYTGTAIFELIADDGFSSSSPATITVKVSDAPLINLDFVERNPRLKTGERMQLVAVGDFADQQDVILSGDYLTWKSESSSVASISSTGWVKGLTDGTTIFSASRGGIQAVTASRVGNILAPSNDTEFNIALAEDYGLGIYPQAVTLTKGMTRQILVGINEHPTLNHVQAGLPNTRYFVSNPTVLQVNSNGLISVKEEGLANVTVVYGASEKVIPVLVEAPLGTGSASVGVDGGVVQGLDGSIITIAPGALDEEQNVSITPLKPEDFSLPIPDYFSVAGAFHLNFEQERLDVPAQVAIPALSQLAPGTEVLFVRLGELPNSTTTSTSPTWLIEESGIVGSDGKIRTTSPPFAGLTTSGFYGVFTTTDKLAFSNSQVLASQVQTSVINESAATSFTSMAMRVGSVGLVATSLTSFGLLLPLMAYLSLKLYHNQSLEIIGIPKYGLPVSTTTGIQINPSGVPTLTVELPTPTLTSFRQNIEKVSLETDSQYGRVIYLEGSRFGTTIDDLEVNFKAGNQIFKGTIIKERSTLEKIAVTSTVLALGDQTEVSVKNRASNLPETERESKTVVIPIPCKVGLALTPQVGRDEVTFLNALNPLEVIENTNSQDLVIASVPVGTEGIQDSPRHLAITKNGARAYVPLELSAQVAVVDVQGLRQLDTDFDLAGINPIKLKNSSAMPSSIVVGFQDKYAYIGDRRTASIYVIDTNIYSPFYNQHVQTIQLDEITSPIAKLAISSDGRRLFATVSGNSQSNGGKIIVVNIDLEDQYKSTGTWHSVIDVISVERGVYGIASTPDPHKMIFTNRDNDNKGIGILSILNDEPTNFTVDSPKYVSLNLGQELDYFDVNEAVDVTITRDGKYAFVSARNSRNFGQGIPSIDDPKAGSNIGIIVDPLGSNPRLVAATRPIPNGYTMELELAHRDDFLYATYPGIGSTLAFNVSEIIETIEGLENGTETFYIDHLKRGVGSPIFLKETKREVTFEDLKYVPIDNINPSISVASDYQLVQESLISNTSNFGVPEGSKTAPLGGFFNNQGLATTFSTSVINLLAPVPDGVVSESEKDKLLRPTFIWDFKGRPNCAPEDLQIGKVELFVSVFDKGYGLLPEERWEGVKAISSNGDANPNRILTATWSNGVWTWAGGSQPGSNTQFQLPSDRILTAGQTYYWTVRLTTGDGQQITPQKAAKFETPFASTSTPFSSITMLTRGLEITDGDKIDSQFESTAEYLAQVGQGFVMYYDEKEGKWYRKNGFQKDYTLPKNEDIKGKPLILIAGWDYQTGTDWNSGFAEAKADTLFASLVQLDLSFGGRIGNSNQPYNSEGKLIRTEGAIFKSPLHFVGVGQGATINSEIIQRIGTFYPNVYGKEIGKLDLQMTTIDAFDPTQTIIQKRNLFDPDVKIWENVTFADNYYQKVTSIPEKLKDQASRQKLDFSGLELKGADMNILLGEVNKSESRIGFTDEDRTTKSHQRSLGWYSGTSNLSQTTFASNSELIYRRLGDLSLNAFGQPTAPTWYAPDYLNTPFKHGDPQAPWEGIGTGWFYSILGGGKDKRPQSTVERTPVSYDNTNVNSQQGEKVKGDYTIPTLFNGNFEAITAYFPSQQTIPGWSFQNNVLQKNLVQFSTSPDNWRLKLGGDTSQTTITHNPFVVPDWGDLRFDLSVLPDSIDRSGRLTVSLKPVNSTDGSEITKTILLQKAEETMGAYETDQWKIGYGIGLGRFETFNINVSSELRGKPVTLTFKLEDSSGFKPTVFLDNIFFKSDLFHLGNPTEARTDTAYYKTNYLIEKSQYSLSYNSEKNTANWVSWEVNKSWLSDDDFDRPKFGPDPDLPNTNWYRVRDEDYRESTPTLLPDPGQRKLYLQGGHMTAAEDRTRTQKDYIATFLTTNLLPQHEQNNNGPWKGLEKYLQTQANNANLDFTIFAGGHDTKKDKGSIDVIDDQGKPQSINVPSYVWKVVVWRQFGEPIEKAEGAFAVYMSNDDIAGKPWTDHIKSIAFVENELNKNPTFPQYNFLSGIQDETLRKKLKTEQKLPPRASLLASNSLASEDIATSVTFSADTSVGHNRFNEPSSLEYHSVQIGKSEISPCENSMNHGIAEVCFGQVSITKNSTIHPNLTQIGSSEVSTLQIAPSEIRATQIGKTQISLVKTRLPENSPTQIGVTEVSSLKVGFGHMNTSQVSPTQIGTPQISSDFRVTQVNSPQVSSPHLYSSSIIEVTSAKVFLSESVSAQQLLRFNIPSFNFPSSHTDAVNNIDQINHSALSLWSIILSLKTAFDIDLIVKNLPDGQLGESYVTNFDVQGRPTGGTIIIDDDANGLGWFIDSTPWENSEFSQSFNETAFKASSNSEAFGKYDLLTTILHEMGHIAGFINGHDSFDSHVQSVNGFPVFVGDNFTAKLTSDRSHLDSNLYPYDLMNTSLAPGVRKLPSQLNLQILNAIRSTTGGTTNNTLTAPLTSLPLLAILNGDFSISKPDNPNFGWKGRGAVNILNQKAVLTENSPFLSNLTQTFVIPTRAKTLQFTLTDTQLGHSNLVPPDAFEVALLDATTLTPLISLNGLTQTDSLLNLQSNGTTYYNPKVTLSGASNTSRIVKVDLSGIAAGTSATLSFDLLGFGAKDSSVTIDDVLILTDEQNPPIAVNDSATTKQNQFIVIDVLANDSIGTFNPQIKTDSSHGKIVVNSDGTISYTPVGKFSGTDMFSYFLTDENGLISNEATVTVTVENLSPNIKEIITNKIINSGISTTFKAEASEAIYKVNLKKRGDATLSLS
uniref:YD repeat protein n=1 Tax=Gloeothece verrucosa (strain PCC 7822) TaxID=497965 RepID=E0UM70_GLOV7|nr:CARDB domain-containing protein [Gloeothece verrucosa]ADN18050.1 YD repeat protein [Gloeothece verrucosa PCC 7822]